MNTESLIKMINQISANCNYEESELDAARLVASHISRFWEPRMKEQLLAHIKEGGHGLSHISLEAAKQLA